MFFKINYITDWKVPIPLRIEYLDKTMHDASFVLLGQGRMRRTYRSPDKKYVLKFPLTEWGIEGNKSEHRKYRERFSNNPYHIEYAPCRIIHRKILMMWACSEIYGETYACADAYKNGAFDSERTIKYVSWSVHIDHNQCGLLAANGKIAAYDYT